MHYISVALLILLVVCDRSTAAQPSATPDDPVPPVAASLGLGATATPDKMAAIEKRAKDAGKFQDQSCGITKLPDGTLRGFYKNMYEVSVPNHTKPQQLHFMHIQHGDHPIVAVFGPAFEYRLRDGVFVLRVIQPSP